MRRLLLGLLLLLVQASSGWAQAVPDRLLLSGKSTQPSLNCNFLGSTAQIAGSLLAGPKCPAISFSRTSTGTYYDVTGVLRSASANVPRIDYGPTPTVTNYAPNSTMAGVVPGTPGTFPTYWATGGAQNLTTTIVGSGVSNGIPYVDLQFSGTDGGAGFITIFPQSSTTAIAALTGQTWTTSYYLALVGGSLPVGGTAGFALQIQEKTSSGAAVVTDGSGAVLPTSTLQRFSYTTALTGGSTTAYMRGDIALNYTPGATVNFTIRIGAPQFELSSTANPWVPTSSSQATVVAPSAGVTNWIRNSTAQGSSVGVVGSGGGLPTNWVLTGSDGLTLTVIGTGTESGIPYIDLQFSGTTSGTGGNLAFDVAAAASATEYQNWTHSFYYKLVGGSLTNVTGFQVYLFDYNAGLGFSGDSGTAVPSPTSASLASQRQSYGWTINDPAAAYIRGLLGFTTAASASVNFTLRIGAPQLEMASSANPWVSTSGAAANVGAVPLGLLIEQQITNLCLQSSALTTSPWADFNTSTTPNAGPAPDGSTNAALVSVTSAGGYHNQLVTAAALTTYTTSAFLKAGSGGWAVLLSADFSGNGAEVWVNLSNGTLGTVQGYGSTPFTSPSATITNIGEGWYRVALTATTTSSASKAGPLIEPTSANGTASASGNTAYAWGVQVEANTSATSYIPTTTATATRAVDSASTPVSTSWYNPTQGTLAMQWMIQGALNGYQGPIALVGSKNGTDFISPIQTWVPLSPGQVGGVIFASAGMGAGGTGIGITTSGLNPMTVGTAAFAWKLGGGLSMTFNGAAAPDTGTVTVLPNVKSLSLGGPYHYQSFNPGGWIQKVQYYPRYTTTAQVRAPR